MDVAVLIPCYNEETTVTKVVTDFKNELPDARIIVFDNNSSDETGKRAEDAGAEVVFIGRRGKGYLTQKMFELIDADIYVMVDGDDTYFAKDVHAVAELVMQENADMAVGRRVPVSDKAMKKINRFGNVFFSRIMSFFFRVRLHDTLSGYRVFNREFIQTIPILSREFQVEAEMTLQALSKGMRVQEVDVDYKERPQGSKSKLSAFRDGYMVLSTIVALFRDLRPLTFFGWIAFTLWAGSLGYGAYVHQAVRYANLFDTVMIVSAFIVGWFFLLIGFSLHTINRRFAEIDSVLKKRK